MIRPRAPATLFAYDLIGVGYTTGRRPDPRWAAAISKALDPARTVVNVGAGTGSYEPAGTVTAVEPSPVMIRQRPPAAAAALRAVAEKLPIATRAVDAALGVLTVHHWTDWRAGIAELRRIAARRVIVGYEPSIHDRFWLVDEYIPTLATTPGMPRPPTITELAYELGDTVSVETCRRP